MNYRLRSTAGVSTLMLFLRYITAEAQIQYLYLLSLPLAWRVLILPQYVALIVLITQEAWYSHRTIIRQLIITALIIITAVWGSLFWHGWHHNSFIAGHYAGWVMFVLSFVNALPQIFKNWHRKSVQGYSIWFVLFGLIAVTFDYSLATIISVPLQTHLNYIRAILYSFIELFQFYLYSF